MLYANFTQHRNWLYVAVLTAMTILACNNTQADQVPSDIDRIHKNSGATDPTTDPLLIEIRDLEAKCKKDTVLDRTLYLRLLRAYQEYYNQHSSDSVAGNYLFEAAILAQKLDKPEKAIELFTNFQEGFPASAKCDKAVYNIAYIYDEKLKNKEKATLYYNKVIELYPKSKWAEEAKAALRLVNMTDEELIRFLEQQNKKSV